MRRSLSMRTLLIVCVCMTILHNSISGDCNKAAVSNALIGDTLPPEEEVEIYLVLIYQAPFFNKIGVNYGMLVNNLPPAEEVVTLMQENNIGKMRFYNADRLAIKACANSGIEIIVGVTNNELQTISSDQEAADKWVNDNIRAYYPATNIKYISVGNLALQNSEHVLPALNKIQLAVEKAGLGDKIKVSTTNGGTTTIPISLLPSKGGSSNSVKDRMRLFLQFLEDRSSPYMPKVFPHFGYLENLNISLGYALFNTTHPVVVDGDRKYTNLFDAMVDTNLFDAMEALGFGNIPIVVTETGWPSYGSGEYANVATTENAQVYNSNLIKHVLSNAGTPKRPGKSMEVFIFSLFNEDRKLGDETKRHFGLFYPNKTLVYPINFYP